MTWPVSSSSQFKKGRSDKESDDKRKGESLKPKREDSETGFRYLRCGITWVVGETAPCQGIYIAEG